MMPVIKHFDPVMGVDIHIVVLPPGVPTPIPHPHIAMIIDPMDYVPVLGATVFIGPLPRASAGTAGKPIPHIPMGGPFVKPPMNEDEIFMGSAMVLADGDPLSFTALPVLSCQDVGMIAPPRKKPKRSYGMVLPLSIVMGIPLGMPVLVGGPPTINMMALGMSAAMKALGPAVKKLRALQRKSTRIKKISNAIHDRAKKLMDKMGVPPNVRNKIHKSICTVTGHPVDVASGKLFTDFVDFELPGPIPLVWERTWYSTSIYAGPLGSGWHHNYDLALIEGEKAIAVRLADGRPVAFPPLQPGEMSFDRAERLTLIRDSHGYALDTFDGLRYRFWLANIREKYHVLKAVTHKATGAQIRFEYDGQHRLRQIIDSGGRFVRLEYAESGLLQKILLPQPGARNAEEWYCAVEYHYQGNMLVGVDDALKQRMSYQYHHGLLVKETYRNGFSFYFRFDGLDHNARCTETWGDGDLYRRHIQYDLTNNITDVGDSLGNTIRYFHDGVLPHRIVDPLGSVSTVEYNEYSQIISETNELGYKTLYEYDEFGNNTQITNPDGATTSMTYDQNHNLVVMEDVVGGKWLYRYNEQNRLIEEVDPLGNRTTYSYDDVVLTSVTNAKGNRYFLEYDQNLNICRVEEEKGIAIETRYDALGNITDMTDAYGNKRLFTHDILGRVVQVNEPDGNVRKMEYDADDNVTDMRDHYSHIQMRYQGLGTLVSRSQQGATVNFVYDTEEQLRTIINEHGTAYEFELDSMGEIVRETGFDGLIRHYYRDAAGQARRVRRPGGRFNEYVYDAMGRVTEIRYSDGDRETYEYRADGELTKASNRAISLKFTRDLLGRVLQENQGEHWVASEVDELGYRINVKSSFGLQQNIERDIRGDVTRITLGEEAKFATEFQRDALGAELQRCMPGGLSSRWHRDKLGRPIKHEVTLAKQVLRSHTYVWGLDDRLQSVVDKLGRETLFKYNALGALTAVKYSNAAFELRVPDAIGNLFRTEAQNDREYGPGGRLLAVHEKGSSIHFEYDAEGNLIRKRMADDRVWRYDWSDAGNLQRVVRPDGKEVRFEYDPFGRRISKSIGGRVTRWVWDGNNPLHEWVETADCALVSKASVHQEAIAADQRPIVLQPKQAQAPPTITTWLFDPETFSPLAKMVGDEYFPMVSDLLGSAVGMFDAQGSQVWSMELDAWGRPRDAQGNSELCPWRWPGQYEDAETGLYYNRFRYYDPDAGQYMSQDPIGLLGGLHLYSYVEDPLTWSDPWGLAKQNCGGAGSQRWKNKRTKSGRPYKKPGPKTNPNAPHNKKIRQILRQEKAKGKIHIGGGSKTEIVLQTPGGKKPYRRMDASFRDPKTGKIEHHNVGKSNRGRGDPIARERDAISDVETYAPPKDQDITFHSYGTT